MVGLYSLVSQGGLLGEGAIGGQPRYQVGDEVHKAPVPRVLHLADVLQRVVDRLYRGTPSQQHHGHQGGGHQLDQTVVGDLPWEVVPHVSGDAAGVEVLEVAVALQVEDHHQGDRLALGEGRWAFGRVARHVRLHDLLVSLAGLNCHRGSPRTFIISYHSEGFQFNFLSFSVLRC